MSEVAEKADGAGLPVLVVFGPTASGKTALAESLFASGDAPVPPGIDSRFRGKAEIISADSMQVYRGMDIGTAKPDTSLLESLPHHLIDIRDPDEQFCAGDFVRLADEACRDIFARGRLPVVLGGTGFYLKNFLFGLPVTPESDPALRAEVIERMRVEGPRRLMEELRAVDPESAARIHPNDEYRIARALEVYRASGRPLSSFALPASFRSGFRFLVVAIERAREELNGRIDSRVDAMFDAGLEGEFDTLVRAGYGPTDPGMQAIGYREFFGASDARAVREAIKNDSRKYAKRQETFIKPIPEILRVRADDIAGFFGAVTGFWDPGRGVSTP